MNTRVNLAGIELKNPVMTCSGTFGSGMEYGELIDLNRLGAVVTKGVANVPWRGTDAPYRGGVRGHAQRHRPSESGDRRILPP